LTALGVLGGTFNPPHRGHLALARAAAEELGLERVLLTPARVAPHKLEAGDPGPQHRLAMCRLLAEEDPRIELCTLELEREGPSYTVDTLRAIHTNEPSAELTLIVGADMARTLPEWREPEEIVRLARLAVAAREGVERTAVLDALGDVYRRAGLNETSRTTFLAMGPVEASSSRARERAAAGESLAGLLSAPVAEYVAAHGLYLERGGRS
jgi:nicotinate-nucleotide adenylyltransferase